MKKCPNCPNKQAAWNVDIVTVQDYTPGTDLNFLGQKNPSYHCKECDTKFD